MSGLSLSPSSSGASSDSSASSGSSTSLTSGRPSPLPEADEHSPIDGRIPSVPDLVGQLSPRCLGGEPNEADVCHPTAFDDIMLVFETDEVEAEGGEAEETGRWLLVDVDNGQDGVEAEESEADDCQPVAKGEFFGFREKQGAEVGQLSVEGLGFGVGPSNWAVDCQVGVRERESSYGGGAGEKGKREAEERRKNEAKEKRKSEAEERERVGAEEKRKSEAEERKRVEAEEGRGGEAEEDKTEHVEESEAEGSDVCTRAIVLAKSLGLGSSSDSDEDDIVDPLTMLADDRQLAVGGESSCRFGECESEGLTEEEGPARGQMYNPGMLDEEWRQKTLALNGEEIANSIYHIPRVIVFACLLRVAPFTILLTAMLGFI